MRFLVLIVLFLIFGYSLALVIANSTQTAVNLLFIDVPSMNLGLLLIISIVLGLIAGLLLGLILFRVIQMKLENQRMSKELVTVRDELMKSQHKLEQHLTQIQDNAGMILKSPLPPLER